MAAEPALLYDSTGTAISIPGPDAPVRAALVPSGVAADRNDRFRGYPSSSLTPRKLGAILREADSGDPLRWIELLEELIEKDPKLASVLSTRYSAVLGLNWDVSPALMDENATEADRNLADEIAKFCLSALRGTNFLEMVGDMLDGIAKPFAVDWIRWGEDKDGKWVPVRFDRIPTRHIRWAYDSDTLMVFDPSNPRADAKGNIGVAFDQCDTVRALSNPRRDHPTRAGLGRTIAWYELFKAQIIKAMMSYIDRYGMPVRVLKVDDTDFDNETRFNSFRANLASMGQDASAVFTKNVELEFEKVATTDGIGVYLAGIDYVDKALAWIVLGHELSSQGSPGGGMLGISAAIQVRQDILEGDCEFAASIIRRDVLTPMVAWNYGWDRVDLMPVLYFDCEPPRDLASEATTIRTIATTFKDLPFSKQQLREQFGINEPLNIPGAVSGTPESDELLPSAAPAPGGPGQPAMVPFGGTDPNAIAVNSLAARRGRPAPRYSPSRQKSVDRLAARGIRLGTSIVDGWKKQLRDAIRTAAKEGVPIAEMRRRILDLYPELDVTELETSIKEESLKARLYGRNA